jgi:SecY interacting protein Syd
LSLLFAWNKDDFERLQENLIGHILMKRRLKQEETVFFAVTDEEDMIISVDNASGSVWVERVGCKPHKQLSDSLAQFISQLTPVVK